MYNEEVKTRFLNERYASCPGKREIAIILFGVLERYENSWGADVCTRSKEELIPAVRDLVGFRQKSLKMRSDVLKDYIKWCKENDIEGTRDDLINLTPSDIGLEKLKKQMVANPKHLQRYLDSICYPEFEETVDCVYRSFYWLAYGGMPTAEMAMAVKTSEVALEDRVVNHKGRTFQIYEQAVPAIKDCLQLESFRCPRASGIDLIKHRYSGNALLRRFVTPNSKRDPLSVLSMRTIMSRKEESYRQSRDENSDSSLNLRLSYFRVWLSGVFYRTYEAEVAGMPVDFIPVAKEVSEVKGTPKSDQQLRKLSREYNQDYIRWKEAYIIL